MSIAVTNGIYPRFNAEDELRFWDSISTVVSSCPVIVQNGSYDIGVLWQHNHIFTRSISMDTHIAAHICFPETPRSLGYLSSVLLNVPPWKSTSSETPGLYNAADCTNTFGIAQVLSQEIQRQGLQEVLSFETSQIYPAVMLQLQGILVDEDRRQKLA
jgi:hypothetical protein